MKKYLLILTLSLMGCTNNNEAIKTMEDNGFTHVQVIDNGLMSTLHGCDKSDHVYYKVSAVNPAGKQVNMIVCCGGPTSFKGCTIRSDY